MTTTTTQTPTGDQAEAYILTVKAIADTLREVGRAPESYFYVPLMSLSTFQGMIARLIGAGVAERTDAHELIWIGPK